ncbi:hotdog fold thioesterase [Gracilibacillus alcaliphilus]|uniref:hotdog fold thioesterase n=1 Tax=Gracilibacillus alcaliphilus TaxID=1401441 RepID=UPI00195931D0|nr:PaaI family thioesterase [Gracilibacillus alcaliphilus]
MSTLGMTVTVQSPEQTVVEMLVTDKVKQPMGFLHGGATTALAETAASLGGMQHVDSTKQSIVGIEINCNHLRSKKDGKIIAVAHPIHVGRTTMVFQVDIKDEMDKLVASSRCTLGIITTTKKNRA